MHRPAPRGPLILDLRELGRRAGAMQVVRRVVPAPSDLGIPVAGVRKGSDLALDLRLESVLEGVLVSGTVTVSVQAECARCLDPFGWQEQVPVQELYVYPESRRDSGADDDDELPTLTGDTLDLEPTLRDAVVLALPIAPVCTPECPGLCPQCGVALRTDPDHGHDTLDPRWAALAGALTDESPPTAADGQ